MNDYNPNFQQPQKQSSNDALLAGAIAAIVGAGLGAGGVAVANTLSDTPEVEVEEETPETEEVQEETTEVTPEPEVIHVVHHVHHRPAVRVEQPQGGRAIAQVGDLRITSVEVMQYHTMPDGTRILGAHCHVNGRPGVVVDVNNDGFADALNYDMNGDGLVNDNVIDLRPYPQSINMGVLAQHADNIIGSGGDALVDGGIAATINATTTNNPEAQQIANNNGAQNGNTATIEDVGGVTTGPVGEGTDVAALNGNEIDPDLPDYTNNANVAAIDNESGNVNANDVAMAGSRADADVQVETDATPQAEVQVEPQPDVAQAEVDYSQQPEAQVDVAQAETPQVDVAQEEAQVDIAQAEPPQADVQVAEAPMNDVAQADVQVETPTAIPEPPADIDPMATAEMGMGGMDNGMDGMDAGMDAAMPDDGGMA